MLHKVKEAYVWKQKTEKLEELIGSSSICPDASHATASVLLSIFKGHFTLRGTIVLFASQRVVFVTDAATNVSN